MAHYDCSHCGASLGIDYGICTSCTPAKVLDLKRKLATAKEYARTTWERENFPHRDEYVKKMTEELQTEYDQAFENGKRR